MDKLLSELLSYCQTNNRICPMPTEWDILWEMLPNRQKDGAGWQPPVPLILAAWWETSDDDKLQRFLIHIQWAHKHGAFEKIDRFVRSLSGDQWNHLGE